MIQFSNVTLRRGPRVLLSGMSLSIFAGQRVGVVGRNGTGKSSLFAMLLGEIEPDAGELDLPGGLDIATVRQETPSLDQSALDYVLDGDPELREIEGKLAAAEASGDDESLASLGELHGRLHAIDGYTAPTRAAKLLYGLGFAPADNARAVREFSGGWRMRLNLAQALMRRSDLLLLDEPTNHLDLDAVIWLQSWLLSYPGTLLVISHDRDFLDAISTHILHLEHGTATAYTGDYSGFEVLRAQKLEQQAAAFAAQQKEIARLQGFIDRFKAKASKATQAQSRVKQLDRMEKVEAAHWDSPFSFAFLEPKRVPSPLIALHDAEAGYDDTPVVRGLRIGVEPGMRIGLLGRNGAGKTTLVKTLAGSLPVVGGERVAHPHLKVGYFAQHQIDQLDGAASPITHLQRIDPRASEQSLRNFLGGYDFRGDRVFEPVGPFSGGERARLALALIAYTEPNLLLLDEPTNHLDMDMRHALERALGAFPGAVLVVSHDRHLIASACDALWLIADGKLSEFRGDLDDYAEWVRSGGKAVANAASADAHSAAKATKTSASKSKAAPGPDARRKAKPLRDAARAAEKSMARFERKISELDAQLADPAIYQDDPHGAAELSRQQADLRKQLDAAETQWMDASEQLEALGLPQ